LAAFVVLCPFVAVGQDFVPASIAPATTIAPANMVPASTTLADPASPKNPSFTLQERWDHYVYRTYSWQRLTLLGLDTAVDMAISKPHNGRTFDAFGDRYTGGLIARSTRTTTEFLAGAVLREDIRRRSSTETAFGKRIKHALIHSFVAYSPEGHAHPAYSRLIGAAAGIYTLSLYNERPMTTGRMAHELSWVLASNVQDSLLNEFSPDMKRFGLKVKNRLIPNFGR